MSPTQHVFFIAGAAAPPASTALAISVISVTLGLNFIITGCLATFFTAFVIRSAEAGTCPKVNIAGVEFNNPVTVASGTFGSGMEYCEYVDLNKLGAVTTKGVANVPWPGNPTPRIAETYGGMINAIGLQNPGLDTFVKRDIPFLKQYDTKIIVNVCGKTEEDYVALFDW